MATEGTHTPNTTTTYNLNLPENIESLCGPEKLVICVDSSCLNAEFKKILRNFLELKSLVNRHEVALCVWNGSDLKWSDFQPDFKNFNSLFWPVRGYSDQSYFCSQKPPFELSKVLEGVQRRYASFQRESVSVRVIILYARVDCLPVLEDHVLHSLESDFPCFTLDILYMPQYTVKCSKREAESERQQAQEIFKTFIGISNPKSYVFAVDESAHVADCVLKFLAHPALRESQKPNWFQ